MIDSQDEDMRELIKSLASLQATLDSMNERVGRINGRLHKIEGRVNHLEGKSGTVSARTLWIAIGGILTVGSIATSVLAGL